MRDKRTGPAAAWSATTATAGAVWAFGGPGFPFGDDERAARMGAVLTGLDPGPAGLGVAAFGTTAALLAVLLRRQGGPGGQRNGVAGERTGDATGRRLRLLGAAFAAALLFLVPDGRLLLAVGEVLTGHPERVEAAALTQAWCTAGALLWAAVAHRGRRRTDAVPAWERPVTLLAAALPLAYAVPRTLWAAGLTFGLDRTATLMVSTSEGRARELAFAAAATGGGLLTLGLTQRWGTRLPSWVPLLGDRAVPRRLATVPATAVAVLLTGAGLTMWRVLAAAVLGGGAGATAFDTANWAAWAGNLVWLPWGATLGLAAWAYHRRRNALG